MENAQILKTKAMREREELRAANMYKFSLIRVRFPDGVILQVGRWFLLSRDQYERTYSLGNI